MKTKPSKIIDVFKLMLVYSYVVGKESDNIIMNQESFAKFLNISSRSVVRHFNTARELGFICITSKKHLYSHKKRTAWAANIYSVDMIKLNNYITASSGYNVLDNIATEIQIYFNFMSFVKSVYQQKIVENMTEEERAEYLLQQEKIAQKAARKLEKLKKKNKLYLSLLEEVNNTVIPLKYLEDDKKRLINVLCSTRNPVHSNDSNRMMLLKKFFDTEKNIVEFDTNASIYRLSYALGNGYCADPDVDIYKLIFDECHFNIGWTDNFRHNFKSMLMPIYMRESSLKFRSIAFNKRKSWKWFLNEKVEAEQKFYEGLEQALNMPIYDILDNIRLSMHKIFNLDKFYKADIFIYESNLHILMLKIFKDLGIKTINVYDGFYFVDGSVDKNLYNQVYEQATMKLLANT